MVNFTPDKFVQFGDSEISYKSATQLLPNAYSPAGPTKNIARF